MSNPYTFYGAELSLYSGKLRAYLRFKGIPHVEVNPSFYTFNVTIKRRVGDAVIPVLLDPAGNWMQDTSEIIQLLEERFPEAAVIPLSPVQAFAARLFELWGDEFWLPTAMHTRWSHRRENYPLFEHDATQGFFPGWPRAVSGLIVRKGLARMLIGFLPKLGIDARTAPLLDAWTEHQLDALDRHFAAQPFLFGSRPSLGDLGLIGPLYAHLGRDPWPRQHLIEPRQHLHAWVQRMQHPVARQGEFLAGDALPETLMPMLRSIFDEMVPLLQSGIHALRAAMPSLKAGKRLPRFLGKVDFPLHSGRWSQELLPYTLWMAQRILDQFRQLPDDDAARVRAWLEQAGGQAFLDLDIPRLRRMGLRAALEPATANNSRNRP